MPLSKTKTDPSQQKSNTPTEQNQISKNRRILFPKKINCCHQTTLDKPFTQPLPDQFKVLATRPRAINYFFQLIRFNTFTFIDKMDGKKMKLVDIAEARWESQTTLSKRWGVSLETIKQIERALKKSVIITTTIRGNGMAQTRYYAFSEVFQAWLRAGEAVHPRKPEPKKPGAKSKASPPKAVEPEPKQDGCSEDPCHKVGYGEYPRMGTENTHHMGTENTPTIVTPNFMTYYNDDEDMPKEHTSTKHPEPPPKPEPDTSSSLKKLSKTDVMKLTDRLNVLGTKPFSEINDFMGEMATKYGLDVCNKTLDINQSKITWNDRNRGSIQRAMEEVANPKAAEARKAAQEAKQEASAQETWNRSDWHNVILDYQENRSSIFKPQGACPAHMQEAVAKAKQAYSIPKQDTDHNQDNNDKHDGAMDMLKAFAPAAANKMNLVSKLNSIKRETD